MFVDRVKIKMKSGDGGDGKVSFYRAKYVPAGGPDGGDGGRGGDVSLQADTGIATLLDFRYQRRYQAANGENGGQHNRAGKSGENLLLKVPVGTVVREALSGKVMADLTALGEQKQLIKGGRGGRGNQHFATPVRQAPEYAEKGKPGKEYEVILELKLIADVGIIGLPNAGKSTLLSMLTNAAPKIAGYPFTTLAPNLGVVRNPQGKDFVLADIPGLIEGASQGVGLGHDFLRHVERTKVLVHVVDASALEGSDPVAALETINHELAAYRADLLERPQLIVANKMDIPEAREHLPALEAYCKNHGLPLFAVSAAGGWSGSGDQGFQPLMKAMADTLSRYPDTIVFEPDFDEYEEVPVDEQPFAIRREGQVFVVEGKGVEKMLTLTDLDTEKGFAFFQRYLREKGIIQALEDAGVEEGNTVKLYELEFEFLK